MQAHPEPASEGHDRSGVRRPATPGGTPQRKQGTGKKPANGVVALSSAAIMAVYAAGYIHTAAAATTIVTPPAVVTIVATTSTTTAASLLTPTTSAAIATATAAPTVIAATAVVTNTTTATVGVIATPTTQATQTAAATSAYKDGTYTGSGTSKHGGVTVAVVIKNGVIVSSAITASNTRYPISRIAALPGEVIAAQSANIDLVSGATDSSTAFQTAVASALTQAKQAQA